MERSLKRKHYQVVKNDLRVELSMLTNQSGDLNNDLNTANEDFELMFKSMTDRQGELLSRSLILEEKYGEVLAVMKDKGNVKEGESSGENIVLPAGYEKDFQKFVIDSKDSLKGHGDFMEEEYQAMEKVFQKYEAIWKVNMRAFRERAEGIEKQKDKLSTKLFEFSRSEVKEEESE